MERFIPTCSEDDVVDRLALALRGGFRLGITQRESRSDFVVVRNMKLFARKLMIETTHRVNVKAERSCLHRQICQSLAGVV